MVRSSAAVAIWLAFGAGASALVRHGTAPTAGDALAPSGDGRLTPASDIDLGPAADTSATEMEPGEELPWGQITPEHSHSVLKKLVAAQGVKELKKLEELEGQLDPEAQAADSAPVIEVPVEQPRVQAPPGQLGVCAGASIYDGPTLGWEDCRKRCIGNCRFWSFWHDSVQHRCKLTMDCARRERDGHMNVSAYRVELDAASEEEHMEQAAGDTGMTPLDPEPQQEGAQEAAQEAAPPVAPEANQTTCSQQGSARKFAVSPESGWHNLGKARTYRGCANTSLSAGYRNLVWNVGSLGFGRCYGFSSDMPDVLERDCEATYCWIFGPASPACGDQNLTHEAADAEADKIIEVETQAKTESSTVETAGAEVHASVGGELHPLEIKEAEQVREQPKGAMQKIKDFFHIR